MALVVCRRAVHVMGRWRSSHMWRPTRVRRCRSHTRRARLAHVSRWCLAHVCRYRMVLRMCGQAVDR